MKPQIANQEIILFTGTSFANREFCSLDTEYNEGKEISLHDKLEKACWNGLLSEPLPGVLAGNSSNGESFIWQISSADNFLCINMGAYDEPVTGESSINPYYFITSVNIN